MIALNKINSVVSSIYTKILGIDGIFNFSKQPRYEIQSGVYSSIRLNIKKILGSYECRSLLVSELQKLIKENPDYICGIETGGIYFASSLADVMKKPLVIFRTHGLLKDSTQIIGCEIKRGSRIAIIDDVCATGKTFENVSDFFKDTECSIKNYSIFIYDRMGDQQLLEGSVLNMSDLIREAKKIGVLSAQDVEFLKQEVRKMK